MLVAVMGNDLSIINAAKASRGTRSLSFGPAEKRLIKYLAHPDDGSNKPHTSPFRHAIIRFEFETSLWHRLVWQDITSQAGMVFAPKFSEIMWDTNQRINEPHRWRWTASLDAIIRWFEATEGTALEYLATEAIQEVACWFPTSIAERTGYQASKKQVIEQVAYAGDHIPVLDHGYVELVDSLEGPTPEESVLSFEVQAPLLVARQWFKYVREGDHAPAMALPDVEQGSGNGDDGDGTDPLYARNERSRRYDSSDPVFYEPQWRAAPEKKKQGSGDFVDGTLGKDLTRALINLNLNAAGRYKRTSQQVAAEQARLFLPAYGLYTSWRWTASVPAVQHFLDQRLGEAAQYEMREFAKAVEKLVQDRMPDWFPHADH